MNSFVLNSTIALCVINYVFGILVQGYINVQCRDNDDDPLDWWYIYKPPFNLALFGQSLNFSFITPDSLGKWEPSYKDITSNSMLQYSLAPIFKRLQHTHTDNLAVVIYDERANTVKSVGSTVRGILMADETGGVWIYHTVPNFVNMKKDSQFFPANESRKGHLLMCMSLDLVTVNAIFRNLKHVYPKLNYFKLPERLQKLLPEWNVFEQPVKTKKLKSFEFTTLGKSLHLEVLTKTAGNKRSLYKKFASNKNIVLDVYEHADDDATWICRRKYSVRSIESISLKYPNNVLYINNNTDQMRFAVSTAAHWQQLGLGRPQYWTCISNLDNDDSPRGGNLLCVENYAVWHAFDNFKVKEPRCWN